jgi:phenylacetate-CoA ligase
MRRMEKITGRSDDMIIIRGVNVFPSQIEELILAIPRLSGQYQLCISREGHMDSLSVSVEARAEVCAMLSENDRAGLSRELQHRVKTMVGVSTQVRVLDSGKLPTTATGKAKRVVDMRPAQV